jgi:hypothetical protein
MRWDILARRQPIDPLAGLVESESERSHIRDDEARLKNMDEVRLVQRLARWLCREGPVGIGRPSLLGACPLRRKGEISRDQGRGPFVEDTAMRTSVRDGAGASSGQVRSGVRARELCGGCRAGGAAQTALAHRGARPAAVDHGARAGEVRRPPLCAGTLAGSSRAAGLTWRLPGSRSRLSERRAARGAARRCECFARSCRHTSRGVRPEGPPAMSDSYADVERAVSVPA